MLGFRATSPFLSRRARIQANPFHPTHPEDSEGDTHNLNYRSHQAPEPSAKIHLKAPCAVAVHLNPLTCAHRVLCGHGHRRRACGRDPLCSR